MPGSRRESASGSRTGTRLNLADCEEHRGKIARAWQLYEDAAATLPSEDARALFARESAAKLAPRLPKLTVQLSGVLRVLPDAARVTRDTLELSRR